MAKFLFILAAALFWMQPNLAQAQDSKNSKTDRKPALTAAPAPLARSTETRSTETRSTETPSAETPSAETSQSPQDAPTLSASPAPSSLAPPAGPVPDWDSVFVNDYAQLLAASEIRALKSVLQKLRKETGIEMTVLTIPTMAAYGDWPEIEPFATHLFNTWGIGDAETNSGILFLVAQNDRQMRIELGDGFDDTYSDAAQDVIDVYVIPAFKDGNFNTGILDGVANTVEFIATPWAAGEGPAKIKSGNNGGTWILLAVVAFIAWVFGGDLFKKLKFRLRACPQCGQKGLSRHFDHLTHPTTTSEGLDRVNISCPHCDYVDTYDQIVPRRARSTSSGSSGFGGGSSSGGGASGRW